VAEKDGTPGAPSKGAIAGGLLDGTAEAIKRVGEPMIKSAPGAARFVLKRIPEGPGYVYDIASAAGEPDKLRGAFGVAGSVLGTVGGAALGGAAGGVNAPIGAALGSAFGDEIGKEIYDQNRDQIRGAANRIEDGIRRGLGDIGNRMNHRWDQVPGR